jgi:hypothetical protein
MIASTHNSAARGWYKALIALMWIALPVIALRYWQVWDRLPARMVTHFGVGGRPNGWMSPQQSLTFSVVLLAVLLTVFSGILLYALRRMRQVDASAWALMGLFYVIVSVVTFICDSVLQYNLSQAPVHIGLIGIAIFASTFIFLVLFLRAQRGSLLPAAAVISEETHSCRPFALVFLIPSAAMIAAAITVPIAGVKLTLAAAALVMISAAAMAWDGFHYIFSTAGIDIRTLGFRLRSIHAGEIQNYFVDRWNVFGGCGIRGIGNRRAYVWGNRGVRIKTSLGEVFLGHSEPQKIVQDLDFVTNHQAHEGKN